MEVLVALLVIAAFAFVLRSGSRPYTGPKEKTHSRETTGERPSKPLEAGPWEKNGTARFIKGKCWVVDGDTIVINGTQIRLAGIDAPELNHPWGRNAKAAMIALCKDQVVTAELLPENSYDRTVAICHLPDGRDLAAELVRMGLAIDWPKFSGGRYKHLEPEGIRKKLWRADAKQKGRYDEKRHG